MLDELRECRVTTPIRVVPNGVDTRRFSPAADADGKETMRRQLGVGLTDPIVLFVGPINSRKGVDLLLRAWSPLAAAYPRLQLVVVGPGLERDDPNEADFRREIKNLAASSRASERIHFTGLVENVEDYMSAADILVFTSRREGMPNVIPEAMAAGLPVVTTPFIGLPAEFGTPGRQYLLADFEPESIAAQVDALLSSQRQRAELGGSARKWVEDNLDVERSIDSYADLYEEVVSASRQRRE
jgi:glycosyltransferase involved in cell wall biosynthesis